MGEYVVPSSVAPLGSNIMPMHVAVNGEQEVLCNGLGLLQFKISWSTPLPYPPLFASRDASQIWIIRSRPPVGSVGFGSKSSGIAIEDSP